MVTATVALVLLGAGLGMVNAHAQGPRSQPGLVWASLLILFAVATLVISMNGPSTGWFLPSLFLAWFFTAGHLWRHHPELRGAGLLSRSWTATSKHRELREYRHHDSPA